MPWISSTQDFLTQDEATDKYDPYVDYVQLSLRSVGRSHDVDHHRGEHERGPLLKPAGGVSLLQRGRRCGAIQLQPAGRLPSVQR